MVLSFIFCKSKAKETMLLGPSPINDDEYVETSRIGLVDIQQQQVMYRVQFDSMNFIFTISWQDGQIQNKVTEISIDADNVNECPTQ